ncbi:hypothetical protein A2U01_0112046, partial [Trifolium medium]|nr:hypothetical protein [Trifolium medium]
SEVGLKFEDPADSDLLEGAKEADC